MGYPEAQHAGEWIRLMESVTDDTEAWHSCADRWMWAILRAAARAEECGAAAEAALDYFRSRGAGAGQMGWYS